MPDEKGDTKLDEEDLPETSLHAHGSKIEDQERREGDVEGETLEDGSQDASDVSNTGGSTSGGPSGDRPSDDTPSDDDGDSSDS